LNENNFGRYNMVIYFILYLFKGAIIKHVFIVFWSSLIEIILPQNWWVYLQARGLGSNPRGGNVGITILSTVLC